MYMTKQEIIDHVYPFIMAQGQAKVGNNCQYRTSTGKKCAVGCLLKDSEYSSSMEYFKAEDINLPKRLRPEREFLNSLQKAHDEWSIRDEESFQTMFTRRVEYLCKENNLVLPEYKGEA